MQQDLLSVDTQNLQFPDANILFNAGWLKLSESNELQALLARELAWEQSIIKVYGQPYKIPRLNAWYGDESAEYGYSGTQLKRNSWHPSLLLLKNRLEEDLGVSFNSVLANWYTTGEHSMGWHSDDEPELGRQPVIASVSLGGPRKFQLKHRFRQELSTYSIELPPGSLLVMSGDTQRYWRHQIPKTKRQVSSRINLTFRQVFVSQ